jgi:hypothetical protein
MFSIPCKKWSPRPQNRRLLGKAFLFCALLAPMTLPGCSLRPTTHQRVKARSKRVVFRKISRFWRPIVFFSPLSRHGEALQCMSRKRERKKDCRLHAGFGFWFGLVGFSFNASLGPQPRARKRGRLAEAALAHNALWDKAEFGLVWFGGLFF